MNVRNSGAIDLGAALLARSDRGEMVFWNMRDPAGKIGFTRCNNVMARCTKSVAIRNSGREYDIAQIHLVFDRARQLGVCFQQRRDFRPQHNCGIVRIEQRPICPVNPDNLFWFNAVPQRQPATVGQNRRSACAHARGGNGR